jgi:hypothetical protein
VCNRERVKGGVAAQYITTVCILKLNKEGKVKVKISLLKAMEAHWVARG